MTRSETIAFRLSALLPLTIGGAGIAVLMLIGLQEAVRFA